MEDIMSIKKTRGAWVVIVKRNTEEKETSLQNSNHQNQQVNGKMEGGGR